MKPVLRCLKPTLASCALVIFFTLPTSQANKQSTVSASSPNATHPTNKDDANSPSLGSTNYIPVNLSLVPDAIPQHEALIKTANLPYRALGMSFSPDVREVAYRATGRASWYGKQFHGRKTSSGERYDMYAMTAAHPTLPIPSYAQITNLSNGRSVIVRVNDRGPFHKGRLVDLSYAAANKLGFIQQGSAQVAVERVWPASGDDNNSLARTQPVKHDTQTKAAPKYLQLGTFAKLASAEAMLQHMQDNLDENYDSKLGIVQQEGAYKLRLGPFQSATAVRNAAQSLRTEQIASHL